MSFRIPLCQKPRIIYCKASTSSQTALCAPDLANVSRKGGFHGDPSGILMGWKFPPHDIPISIPLCRGTHASVPKWLAIINGQNQIQFLAYISLTQAAEL